MRFNMNNLNDESKNELTKGIVSEVTKITASGDRIFDLLSAIDPSLDLSELSTNEKTAIYLYLSNRVGQIANDIISDELSEEGYNTVLSIIDNINACMLEIEKKNL